VNKPGKSCLSAVCHRSDTSPTLLRSDRNFVRAVSSLGARKF